MSISLGKFFTTEEAAEYLNVTPGRVRQFVMRGRLVPTRKIGMVLFFAAEDVKDFAKIPRIVGRPLSSNKSA